MFQEKLKAVIPEKINKAKNGLFCDQLAEFTDGVINKAVKYYNLPKFCDAHLE